MEVQECTKCGQIFPLTTEYWYQRTEGKFSRLCRACALEQKRQYYADPEIKKRILEQKRQYHAKPEVKERIREYQRGYIQQYHAKPEVKERIREYQRKWMKGKRSDPEVKKRIREWGQQYYAKPEVKERIREYQRGYIQQYYAKPEVKERAKIKTHKRRAEKRALPVLWSVMIQRTILSKFGNYCAYCGAQQGLFREGKMSWDHYIPLKAGVACPGTVPWNMVPACITCNCSKQDSDPRKWLIERFGKRQGGARARAIEAHLARMRAEYGGEEPLTPTLPPISGEGGQRRRRTGDRKVELTDGREKTG